MNGAAPVAPSISSTPSSPNTTMNGVSHHFALSFMNPINSPITPRLAPVATVSNDS